MSSKISALAALTGANTDPGDLFTLVDVSDTSMAATGTNKYQTRQEMQTYNAGTLTSDVKALDLSATWNAGGVTFTGLKLNVTDTASAAASLLCDLQVGGTSVFKVDKAGTGYMYPSATSGIKFNDGLTGLIGFYYMGIQRCSIYGSPSGILNLVATNSNPMVLDIQAALGSGLLIRNTGGVFLFNPAAEVLEQRNGTNAQVKRIYNTYTDASNYERLGITWAANVVSIKPESAGTGATRYLHISGLPTSNPGPGILWNNAGTPAIGT